MAIATPQALSNQTQRFVLPGCHSWADFKAIQTVLDQKGGVQITYLDGVIELITGCEYHEYIKSMIGLFLCIHFWKQGIEFIPVGSATRSSKEKSVSFEPDESYYLGEKKEHPDLAIEVNITSGSPQKLEKYQRLGIREVWMWQDEKFSIYTLNDQGYEKVSASKLLPQLNFSLLEECILMPSRLDAIQKFTNA